MAKMFYTMEEAAQKLGVTEAELKELAVTGKLQQFRDRDKLMFKREQIDALASGDSAAGGSAAGTAAGESGPDAGDTDQIIPLVDSGDTDAIDLSKTGSGSGMDSARSATGISVFDTSEVGEADPMAQTQMTGSGSGGLADDAELSLESVGSGSGLLDLTHESDDTSLGAELLDEIYPGGSEGSDIKMGTDAGGSTGAASSSGPFDTGMGVDMGAIPEEAPTGEIVTSATMVYGGEPSDPAGNGLAIGMLIGATAAMVLALIVAISLVQGVPSELTGRIGGETNTLYIWAGGLLGGSIVLGLIGMFIAKALDR
jgi:hypothetical protein